MTSAYFANRGDAGNRTTQDVDKAPEQGQIWVGWGTKWARTGLDRRERDTIGPNQDVSDTSDRETMGRRDDVDRVRKNRASSYVCVVVRVRVGGWMTGEKKSVVERESCGPTFFGSRGEPQGDRLS